MNISLKTKWIFIVIIICMTLAVSLYTMKTESNAEKKYNYMINEWQKELKELKILPTSENIFTLQNEYQWLKNREKELKDGLAKKQMPDRNLTPLQFKEELLDAQIKLKQLADIQGCKLQEDLGFSEYTSGGIPNDKDVNVLQKQLNVVNELLNLLLKHKVSEISSINRIPVFINTGGDLYKETVFSIEVNCSLEELLGALKDIINSPYILIVRNIKINKLDEDKVNAELVIGAVEFNFNDK